MLSRCIEVDQAAFARDHWGRRPLLSVGARLPRDFDDLLSTDDVDELIAERGVRAPFIRMARDGSLLARECYVGPAGFGAEMGDQVDSAKVLAEYAAGATIVLQGLHRLWPPVIDFVRAMVDDLGHPVQANAYITPPSNRGFDPHYDVHDVFVLQTAGHKHWTVHAPVHPDPLDDQPWTRHRAAINERVAEEPFLDVVLEPGDSLYLPRGWVHSAQALGETSIHLTIGTAAVTGIDVLNILVAAIGESSADLRASLPMGIDLTAHDDAAAIAAKTMALLVDVVRERGDELADAVAPRLAARHAERTRPEAIRPLSTMREVADLSSSDAVVWRHGLVADVRPVGDRIQVVLADRVIDFPHLCAPAIDALRRGTSHRAGSLPGLDEHDGVVLARRLLREAVIVRVDVNRP